MPAKTRRQANFMGMVNARKHGHPVGGPAVQRAAESMDMGQVHDFMRPAAASMPKMPPAGMPKKAPARKPRGQFRRPLSPSQIDARLKGGEDFRIPRSRG